MSIPQGSNLPPSFLVTAAGIRSLANNLDDDDEKTPLLPASLLPAFLLLAFLHPAPPTSSFSYF